MLSYYNEWEKYPAEWLRNLILTGEIPEGVVDETDIRKLDAKEIQKYDVCHFFAGIGGWPYALKLAGWDPARPVWSGSCPCQPFSVAGAQKAQADDRHLWPYFFRLIRECHPPTIFMEQVRGAITHGWLDEVSRDLESEGYAVGSAILPARGVGAPHRRERLWIVADARGAGRGARGLCVNNNNEQSTEQRWSVVAPEPSKTFLPLADTSSAGRQQIPTSASGYESSDERRQENTNNIPSSYGKSRGEGALAHPNNKGSHGRNSAELPERAGELSVGEGGSFMADTTGTRWNERKQTPALLGHGNTTFAKSCDASDSDGQQTGRSSISRGECGFWEFEPDVGRVANGVPARVGRLRAYGNAIVPQVAAAFIEAFLEAEGDL